MTNQPGVSHPIYGLLPTEVNGFDSLAELVYVSGPGHGGPAVVGNTYLEGTYSEIHPNISQDEAGLRKLFLQFSFPGGIPSHASPECPGSIHEGGELGYSLSHSFGAVFDNPKLVVACVVGDGEAETGPLATAWHSNKFLNPATDVAMACCGDVPTLETLAAVSILREHLPDLKIRVVNVVDLMKLQPQTGDKGIYLKQQLRDNLIEHKQ